MRRATRGEVCVDAGKTVRISAAVPSTADFDRLLPATKAHKAGIGDWRKLGQPHTVDKLRQEPARRGNSKPRLADTAGTGQRDEPVC
jgi:hypothetical protein